MNELKKKKVTRSFHWIGCNKQQVDAYRGMYGWWQ
jgi:hypothetical protein